MDSKKVQLHEKNKKNLEKYNITAWFYDILDFPWEMQYKKWRPGLVGDMRGNVIEVGIGTGRNLKYYHPDINLTGIDLCPAMLRHARRRSKNASCNVELLLEDACQMKSISTNHYDWVMSSFLCCVLPNELQPLVLSEIERILKPGGKFRLLEMMYSDNPSIRKRQDFFTPFVEKVYGARFDRETMHHLQKAERLQITNKTFLKHDVYLLIEGERID